MLGSNYTMKKNSVSELSITINKLSLAVNASGSKKLKSSMVKSSTVENLSSVKDLQSTSSVETLQDLQHLLVELPQIEYPVASLKNKEEGIVRIFLSIDKQKEPSIIKIIKSSGYKRLDNSAHLAIKGIKVSQQIDEGIFPKDFLLDIAFSL